MNYKLTDRLVGGLEAPAVGHRIHWDEEIKGLGLRITARNSRAFVLRYATRGRERRLTLGRWPVVSTAKARKLAIQTLGRVMAGHDPLDARRQSETSGTVNALCDRYLDEYVDVRCRPSTQKEFRRLIDTSIRPRLGGLRVDAVTSADVARLHHAMRDTPRQANIALAILHRLFHFAEVWKLKTEGQNPARHIERYPETRRDRFLSDAELGRIGGALKEAEAVGRIAQPIIDAIRLLLMSGLRLSEALHLRWEDVDLANCRLTVRDGKTGKREHPVSGTVALYLAAVREKNGASPWVLPSPTDPTRHLPKWTLENFWRNLRARLGLTDVRLHDARHTTATHAASLGGNAFLIRDLLGHSTVAMSARYANRNLAPVAILAGKVSDHVAGALGLQFGGQSAEVITLPGKAKGSG